MEQFSIQLKNGKRVHCKFEPNYFNDKAGEEFAMHHLEFHGHATSETGYRSHFFPREELGNKNIKVYALEFAEELAKEIKPTTLKLL